MFTIILIIIGFLLVIVPIILTVINVFNLIKKDKLKPKLFDSLTFILGIAYTIILWKLCDFKDYNIALRLGGAELVTVHSPLASWSMQTVITILIIGIISYLLLRNKKLNLPPLIAVLAMSGNLLTSIFFLFFIIQVSSNILSNYLFGFLILFPINYMLCSARAEIEILRIYKEKKENVDESKILNKFDKLLMKIDIDKWPIVAILISLPVAIVIVCFLVLFGQRPDEFIKAFTETSDWTLSKMYSPPNVYYDGHYLCTVSLRGHKNIVKPLRFGLRKGEKIVVNRQLCIANAFEELIAEKNPKLHHFIRHVYDKYGYPVSKHIKTPLQADITYYIMKPLEWIFLITLYLFDIKPENRIARQYLPKIKEEN